MTVNLSFARSVRLGRLFSRPGRRALVVPLDHSVTDGPITSSDRLDRLVGDLSENGVDAVVLHKGTLRHVDPRWFESMSLVVHLSASTVHAPDPDAKYLVASVDEAMRLGADAVSVHVNVGSAEEHGQVRDLAAVADACDRWNLPLLAMMYPRGPRIDDPHRADLVAHAAMLAADLGADVVKTPYAHTVAEMADVVRACPIPLVVAGGPRRGTTAEVLGYVEDVLRAGAAGVAMGRNVFEAPEPGLLARQIAGVLHGRPVPIDISAAGRTAALRTRSDLHTDTRTDEETDHEALLA